jgi:hypothetical protein
VVLLQGDVHAQGEPGRSGKVVSREAFLEHAARFGVWPTFERFVVPAEAVTSVRRLGDTPPSPERS